jgi:hypothetical protein
MHVVRLTRRERELIRVLRERKVWAGGHTPALLADLLQEALENEQGYIEWIEKEWDLWKNRE